MGMIIWLGKLVLGSLLISGGLLSKLRFAGKAAPQGSFQARWLPLLGYVLGIILLVDALFYNLIPFI
ncbi:hypothetical protein IT575_08145 [bacterium]|nr:hypothetical protein [bacterium]